MKTLLIICEAGHWRSGNLAREISIGFKKQKIKARVVKAGYRNKEKSPYFNPPKFLAYMFMTRLTQKMINESNQIIIAAPEIYYKLRREFKIPNEKTICYDIEDYKSLFDLLPIFNHKFKKRIGEYARLYINKHRQIFKKPTYQPIF
ncbi:MAG: hypothetical protein IB618_03150 [Candidatus Pacearchaeota archaeon]|nr:MAG: hypothetical protein IB618_03150 [Candidatus Pacearchaeota archaeon]